MNWLKIDPSTVDIIQLGVNLVVRTIVLTLVLTSFLLFGLGFNWLINFALEILKAPEVVKMVLSQIAFVYIFAVGVAATLTSARLVVHLTIADLSNFRTQVSNDKNGGDDGKNKTPSD